MVDGAGKSGSPLDTLTAKQREALELLLQHKTSKEIAQILGISPHTVDQRIDGAKEKLGAATRGDLAVIYRRLSSISGRMTYEDSHIAARPSTAESVSGLLAGQVLGLRPPELSQPGGPALAELDFRVVPEWFDGRYGTLARLSAIITIAVFFVFIVLGGLAIFSQLSEMMAA